MTEALHVMLMERNGDHPEWTKFLRTAFETNKPWNQIVREILHPNSDDEASRGAGTTSTLATSPTGFRGQPSALAIGSHMAMTTGERTRFFVGPTIFDRVTPEMTIGREEIFGPVLSVMRVDTLEDAIALVNAQAVACAVSHLLSVST
jgi:hypothetical protein